MAWNTVPSSSVEVSRLLRAWGDGDQAALNQLTPLVYTELHQIAHRHMRQQLPGQTLQTTALVNEAYLRLVDVEGVRWQDRTHFFAVSAQIMRRILVDSARAHLADKRGGRLPHVYLDDSVDASPQSSEDLIALDDALNALEEMDPRKARVVELRFFAGLSVEQTAEALKISAPSVKRDWKLAKAWLTRELSRR
ncbi:MAG: sigma-70 family RNA polymerase sigma factor [Bryobacteraceae bacterium]